MLAKHVSRHSTQIQNYVATLQNIRPAFKGDPRQLSANNPQFEQRRLVGTLSDIQAHSSRKVPRRSPEERASGSWNVNNVGNTRDDDNVDNVEDDMDYNGDYSDDDNSDNDEDDEDDDNVDVEDDADNPDRTHDVTKDKTRSTADQTSIPCPHPRCRKEGRKFATRGQLSKHTQSRTLMPPPSLRQD